jgi:cytochrome c biogenesis protein
MSIDEVDTEASETPETPKDDRGRTEIIQPKLGLFGWLRWTWRQLTSMRTALLLLLLLAVAAIPGSVLPQNRIDPARVQTYLDDHRTAGPWLQRLHGFDVYSSPWFSAIYLLLFISLVGCVLPRSRQHWKAIRARPPRAPRRLERMPAYRRDSTDRSSVEVLEAARKALRRRHYRVAIHEDSSVSAERGYLSETGNLAFHLALLGLLVAVAAGTFFGYNGQRVLVVGKSWSNTLPQYDSFSAGRRVDPENLPPYSFSLDDVRVTFDDRSSGNQFGAPRDFEARVTYRSKPGAAPQQRTIKVNQPLDVDGARVFLVGNGYAPIVTIRDGNGDVAFSGPVPFVATDAKYTSNGVVKAPDALPAPIGLIGILLPTEARLATGQPISVFPDLRNPKLIFNAWTGDMGMDSGIPRSVYTLDLAKMKQLTVGKSPFSSMLGIGQSVDLPDHAGSVTFEGVKRYAALNVRSDPTKAWVLLAAIIALAGLILSLFVRRRRVWVRAVTDPQGRTVVEVAGLVRQQNVDLTAELTSIMDDVRGPDVTDLNAADLSATDLSVTGLDVAGLDVQGLDVEGLDATDSGATDVEATGLDETRVRTGSDER